MSEGRPIRMNPYDLSEVARADKLSPAEKGMVIMRSDLAAANKRIEELEAEAERLRNLLEDELAQTRGLADNTDSRARALDRALGHSAGH